MAQETGTVVERAYSRLAQAIGDVDRVMAAAQLILAIYDDFCSQLCEYPYCAKRAFESMDPHASVNISMQRLGLYSRYIAEHGPKISESFPELSTEALDRLFVAMIVDRYEADIVPLPVYLESAGERETRSVIARLGQCIRNNAATNIFNRDLDSRNYGVGRYGRIFLFDYDAVEKLTDVKIRTNSDREPGADSVPAWFFETGAIFLPDSTRLAVDAR